MSKMNGSNSNSQNLVEEEIKSIFKLYDHQNNNTIEIKDFGTLLRTIGFEVTEGAANNIAEKIDRKAEGVIHYEQFKKYLLEKLNSESTVAALKQAFWSMDVDSDGSISIQDLRTFTKRAGVQRSEQDLLEMLQEGDTTGNQSISYDQFVRMMLMR